MAVRFEPPAGVGVRRSYTFRVADVLFLLAHDEFDRPRLRPSVQALVLAAGLLGELALDGDIRLREGCVRAASREKPREKPPGGDLLGAGIFSEVLASPCHEVPVWLRFLARMSTAAVTGRLHEAGVLEFQPGPRRRLFWARAGPTHTLTDRRRAELSWLVPVNKLQRQDVLSTFDVFVVGVALGAGLDKCVLEGASPGARAYAGRVVEGLMGLLGQLVVQVEGLIANDVLLYR